MASTPILHGHTVSGCRCLHITPTTTSLALGARCQAWQACLAFGGLQALAGAARAGLQHAGVSGHAQQSGAWYYMLFSFILAPHSFVIKGHRAPNLLPCTTLLVPHTAGWCCLAHKHQGQQLVCRWEAQQKHRGATCTNLSPAPVHHLQYLCSLLAHCRLLHFVMGCAAMEPPACAQRLWNNTVQPSATAGDIKHFMGPYPAPCETGSRCASCLAMWFGSLWLRF